MSAVFDSAGTVRQLDAKVARDIAPTEKDVTSAPKLVKLLYTLMRQVSALTRRWWPERVEFEGISVTDDGVTLYRFEHGFGQRVRWNVVNWLGSYGWCAILDEATDASGNALTDNNTLVLVSYSAGKMTLRIEEAG